MDEVSKQEFIKKFVEMLGVSVTSVDVVTTAAHTMFTIQTPDSKELIGPHGEHLRALNYVLRRLSERTSTETNKDERFLVDVNGYQMKQISSIEQKAKLLADRVRTFKSSADMAPMSAYERMIVHAMFTDDPEISTSSDGIGPNRHIILSYKNKEQ
jgi:spoIIIJ-associated protein